MKWVLFASAMLAASGAHIHEAAACSAPACMPPAFTPSEASTVPSNLPAIYWRPMGGSYDPVDDVQQVTLTTAADPSTPLAFTATKAGDGYLLVTDEPLAASTSYVLTDNNTCDPGFPSTPPTRTFQTGSAAPLPTSLGALLHTSIRGPLDVWTSSGSCTTPVDAAYVAISLSLAPDAMPWRNALHLETLVDGVHWGDALDVLTGTDPVRLVDTIYRVCATTDQGASPGVDGAMHEVVVRATLPGSTLSLTTAPITIQLACESDPDEPDPMHPPEHESSGGCAATRSGSAALVLLVLAVVALRRRRG